jgi:hypothetical protein
MLIACWIPKAENTHSVFIILTPFPLQQWLHERASMLSNSYIVMLLKQLKEGTYITYSYYIFCAIKECKDTLLGGVLASTLKTQNKDVLSLRVSGS